MSIKTLISYLVDNNHYQMQVNYHCVRNVKAHTLRDARGAATGGTSNIEGFARTTFESILQSHTSSSAETISIESLFDM